MTTQPDTLDPTVLLAEALASLRATDEAVRAGEAGVEDYARIQALASIAHGAALLMPTPDEVLAAYRETTEEVLGEEAEKVAKATRILQEAKTDGSRRHPAIYAALEALGHG
jgi:TRAP-type mannitol/chloroaromatic compound transport system substrate-binding protein